MENIVYMENINNNVYYSSNTSRSEIEFRPASDKTKATQHHRLLVSVKPWSLKPLAAAISGRESIAEP
jgi:hypothetical protein